MPSVPIESWEERQDREDRIDKAMRAARLHRRTAPLTRDRNRKYKCKGCPDDHPCVKVRWFYPLLCAFCVGGASQKAQRSG